MILTTRLLSLICLVLITTTLARAQGDSHMKVVAKVGSLVNSGNEKVNNKDFDGGISDFTEAIRTAKSLPTFMSTELSAVTYQNRGLAFAQKGDLNAALADMNKAIKLKSDSAAYTNRARVYEQRKEIEKALADFGKAIKLNRDYPMAYRARGLLLLRQGKDADAEVDFAKYLRLFPNRKESLETEIQRTKEDRSKTQP